MPRPATGRRPPSETPSSPAPPKRALLAGAAALALAAWFATVVVAAGSAPRHPGHGSVADPARVALASNVPDHDDAADHLWQASEVIPVDLASAARPAADDGIHLEDWVVTIGSSGTYRLSGTMTDGQIVVDTEEQGLVRLILDGVNVTNLSGPALRVAEANEVMIVLADGSTNALTAGTPAAAEQPAGSDPAQRLASDQPGAALFSKANLTISGTGALTATGNINDGITSKDGLVIDAGAITVKAVDDGIRGRDYLAIHGGTLAVTAGGDGLKSDNEDDPKKGYISISNGGIAVTAGGDAVAAATDVITTGGTLTASAGGGSTAQVPEGTSAKAVKGDVNVVVGGGKITADSAEDAINSDTIVIDGGTLSLATGDDGIHADSALTISDGDVAVIKSFEALEALKPTISGGTVTLTAANDGINASQDGVNEFTAAPDALVSITGGTLRLRAGDDGIDSNGKIAVTGGTTLIDVDFDGMDSNGSLTMTGGTVVVTGAEISTNLQNGLEILGTLNLSGGTLLVTAASAFWNQPAVSSAQGWLYAKLDAKQAASTAVHLVANGEVIASYLGGKAFQAVLFSSDRIVKGQQYDVYVGGEVAGTQLFGGMYTSGNLEGAAKIATVTAGQGVVRPTRTPTRTPTSPSNTQSPTETQSPSATEPPTGTQSPSATQPPTETQSPSATEPPTESVPAPMPAPR